MQIILYSTKVGYSPDYVSLLQNIMRANPDEQAVWYSTPVTFRQMSNYHIR